MILQIYLPAIAGHVPNEMVKTISAFLEFCYLVRRSVITEDVLVGIRDALHRFHQHRQIFLTTNVQKDFNLPRQHSMTHYQKLIELFGAPNGLCSSITESKHIKAVKKPWRRSNRHKALGQMLLTNQRIHKLTAARIQYTTSGLMHQSSLPQHSGRVQPAKRTLPERDNEPVNGSMDIAETTLAKRCGLSFVVQFL